MKAIAAGLIAACALASQAAAGGQPKPCWHAHTVGGVKYLTLCGSAAATFRVGSKTYRVKGGYCYLDPNGNFHVSVGSVDADKPVGSDTNKVLKLLYFGFDTASRRVGHTYLQADVFYVLPGDHPPGESVEPFAKVVLVGASRGSLTAPYADPAFSATFHC